jgi:hypothetical protein
MMIEELRRYPTISNIIQNEPELLREVVMTWTVNDLVATVKGLQASLDKVSRELLGKEISPTTRSVALQSIERITKAINSMNGRLDRILGA